MKKERLISAIVKNYPLCEIVTRELIKNGNLVEGIIVFQDAESKKRKDVAPIFYPSEIPDIAEDEFEAFVEQIKETLDYAWNNNFVTELLEEDKVNKVINMVLVPKCQEDVPCRDFMNMKIVYYIDTFGEDNSIISSKIIDNSFMKEHDLTEEKLFKISSYNVRMYSMIYKIMDDNDDFFAITNRFLYHGASALVRNEILSNIHKKIGDFYIIPSSIHEILVMKKPDTKDAKNFINERNSMIKAINSTMLNEEDVLSDQLFEYDGTLKFAS